MTIASVSTTDKVSKTKFNEIQSLVSTIIGTGSSNYGYGNSLYSSQKSEGDKISSTDWANLSLDLYRVSYHQGSSISPTAITTSTKITATVVNTYIDAANTIDINRFRIAEYSDELLLTNSRTTAWNATVTHAFYIDFVNHDNARYFFNSGSSLRFSASIQGYSNSQGTSWNTMLSSIGTIYFNYNSITALAGTATSNFGFYNLTGSYQQAYIISGSGRYSSNDYKIRMSYDGAGKIYVIIDFEDLHTNTWTDLVDGTLTSIVSMRRASGSHISVSPPTVTNTTLL